MKKLESDWDRFYSEINAQEYAGHSSLLDANLLHGTNLEVERCQK